MAKLSLSVAVGDYDRNRLLIDGAVQIDGVDPVFMKLYPEEIFFRAFRSEDFDICECSLSSFTVKTAANDYPYVGVPAFVSRMFRHTSLYCRTDRIQKPEDLKGEIDGFLAPRAPTTVGEKNVGWLFRDPVAAAKDYYKRTKIFPIMHLIGVRRTLAEKHPWLPAAVLKAFEQSKAAAMAHLWDTSATKVALPFVEERVAETRALMGDDYWPYGVESNRKTLDTFLHHHHAQGLSSRRLKVEELFHPGTLESFKI